MKALAATAAVGLALAASGCTRDVARPTLTKLDCPKSEEGLRRVSAAADGKTCGYVSEDGAEVTLRLIPVVGGVDATLKAVEAELRAQIAPAATASGGEDSTPPSKSPDTAADAAAVVAQAEADARGAGREIADNADWNDESDTDRPRGSKDRARIDLPGVHIDAGDDEANVRIGPLHIDAQDEGAVIRMQRNVRLRGEALRREKRGVRATFVLAGDEAPQGYRFAGYEAGGPRTGPLVVATVRSTGDGGGHPGKYDQDDVYDAVKKLVRKNAGV